MKAGKICSFNLLLFLVYAGVCCFCFKSLDYDMYDFALLGNSDISKCIQKDRPKIYLSLIFKKEITNKIMIIFPNDLKCRKILMVENKMINSIATVWIFLGKISNSLRQNMLLQLVMQLFSSINILYGLMYFRYISAITIYLKPFSTLLPFPKLAWTKEKRNPPVVFPAGGQILESHRKINANGSPSPREVTK
ncbi:hypothetical protein EGR_02451 [Echinococcus granulosus]|uniref:Uncharacterized protein n=1 Tax=Echinococcus granulosus TaxID=6210 RepID=W6UM83_ECHGR|nr:hypothetical protein EGR_02451 [Echinococcus granulosus]EUB62655.1 hypothetical protein EGR_02451 [Echinococcus granulosus]